ncbi:hypothetical protein [Staphylococcus xylosus]|uniref:hypothetical protein n=1 Tax=Staphylococcus xylosus TaxID=1288 RepID=UPI00403EEDFE
MKKIVLCLISLVLVLTFTIPNAQASNFDGKNYTGEQLFEGIFFGYGEVGKQFNELWEKTEFKNFKLQEGFTDRVHNLENKLKQREDNYFVKFKQSVTSGNRLKIQQQFKKVNDDITEIGEEEMKQKDGKTTYAIKPGFVAILAWSYVGATHIAAAVVLTVVAAGNYAVVGNKVYGVRSVETISEGLSQDEYIDLIAKRL